MKLGYLGKSSVDLGPYRTALSFRPNLCREPVWFDGTLRDPLRFREVLSALHEVVVGDLRVRKKDRSAHEAWKKRKAEEERQLREALLGELEQKALVDVEEKGPPPKDLEKRFRKAHKRYWKARRTWAWELMKHDPELWRHLVPCDPVVTVAPDVVLFEGFSKDESSYGCVTLDREALDGKHEGSLGTTNVDYSLALYEHFQALRTYRETRLHVDPQGFEVAVEGQADYREEKIDLPPSWLRGFGQISAATGLPTKRVELSLDVLYSLLARLRRRRAKESPRDLRFTLRPGKAPEIAVMPWGETLVSSGPVWEGEREEVVRVWGRRRLLVLARALPFVERVEVHLLGDGLPSLWVLHLGPMRFVLGLSGWTANDWSGGAALDLLADTWEADEATMEEAADLLFRERRLSLGELERGVGASPKAVRGALQRLAKRGQVVYDFAAGVYRWRQILPEAIGEAQLGPEPEEVTAGRRLFAEGKVTLLSDDADGATRFLKARVRGTECEALLDGDGRFREARCPCPFHRRFRLKQGPCRHLFALRLATRGARR